MALFLDIEPGDAVRIGKDTVVVLEGKSGKRARLRITSLADVKHMKGGQPPAQAGLHRQAPVTPPPAPEPAAKPTLVRKPR